jgi:hypothetical protein
MRHPRFQGLRGRLSYANVIATLAFFFALTGGAMAGVKYIAASDTIPTTSDLAGSTYGNPLIAAGKVTSAKIADGAITSSKFDSSAIAPNASKVGGYDIVTVSQTATIPPSGVDEFVSVQCPRDRIPIHGSVPAEGPDVQFVGISYGANLRTFDFVNNGSGEESATMNVSCLGSDAVFH